MKPISKAIQILCIAVIIHSCSSPEEEADPCASGPEISGSNTTATTTGKSTGKITVQVASGKAPYQYSLDGGAFQSDNTFTGLAANTYSVTAKDANGCTDAADVTIPAVPEVSFASQVKPIIDTNCQKSGCHGSNGSLPSFGTYNQVFANAANIKTRTSNKSMPPSGALADASIQLIADWVAQGAPNN